MIKKIEQKRFVVLHTQTNDDETVHERITSETETYSYFSVLFNTQNLVNTPSNELMQVRLLRTG